MSDNNETFIFNRDALEQLITKIKSNETYSEITKGYVFAGPVNGEATSPHFRKLNKEDLPENLNYKGYLEKNINSNDIEPGVYYITSKNEDTVLGHLIDGPFRVEGDTFSDTAQNAYLDYNSMTNEQRYSFYNNLSQEDKNKLLPVLPYFPIRSTTTNEIIHFPDLNINYLKNKEIWGYCTFIQFKHGDNVPNTQVIIDKNTICCRISTGTNGNYVWSNWYSVRQLAGQEQYGIVKFLAKKDIPRQNNDPQAKYDSKSGYAVSLGQVANTLNKATATTSRIGFVKIGDHIDIDGEGKISIPEASTNTMGVVKIGDHINIDNNTNAIYIPETSLTASGVVQFFNNRVEPYYKNGQYESDWAPLNGHHYSPLTNARTFYSSINGNDPTQGKTLSYSQIKQIFDNKYASTAAAGVVKIGDNINISTTGTITVPLASANTAGVVKIGNNININNSTGVIYINNASTSQKGVVQIKSSGGLKFSSNNELIADTNVIQAKHKIATTASISFSNSTTVNVIISGSGVTTDNTIIVSPTADSWVTWRDYGIRCTGQNTDTITLTADEKFSTTTVGVNVVILN